jgi:TatA/E family protein of Tat protein translocase
MGPLGVPELIVIFIVALVVFGPKKLPELGKSLGRGLREFNKAKSELKATWDEQIREAETHLQDTKESIHQPIRETIAAVNAANPVAEAPHEPAAEPHTEASPEGASTDSQKEPPTASSGGS